MGYVKCCVPGCEDKTSPRHRFPNPNNDMKRLNLWLDVIQNEHLFEIDPMRLYADRRVCRRHFDTQHYSVGSKRVHLNAVPTLYLPGCTEVEESRESVPIGVAGNQAIAIPNLSGPTDEDQIRQSVTIERTSQKATEEWKHDQMLGFLAACDEQRETTANLEPLIPCPSKSTPSTSNGNGSSTTSFGCEHFAMCLAVRMKRLPTHARNALEMSFLKQLHDAEAENDNKYDEKIHED